MRRIALPDRALTVSFRKNKPGRRDNPGHGRRARFAITLGLASVGIAAIATATPVVAASAAPIQPPQAVHVVVSGGQIAIPVRLTPGRHTINETTSADPAAARQVSPDASPQIQVRVGKNNCAGYNGDWELVPVEIGVGIVNGLHTWGTIWDDCGQYTHPTTVYLYFNLAGSGQPALNVSYQGPTAGGTGDVSAGVDTGWALPSDSPPPQIVADACLKWNNGWGCGPSEKI
jgi:hypothetical protein